MALITLTVFTALLKFNTLFATDSIDGLLQRLKITENFLDLVIIPVISNDPTTVIVGMKDLQELMLVPPLGRCVQIAFLVFPFTVLLAWMKGIELSIDFDGYQIMIMLAGILVIKSFTLVRTSHWLVGALLVADYTIVGVSSYYCPWIER